MIFSPAPQPGAPHTSQRYHVVWVGLREQSAGRPAGFPPGAGQVTARGSWGATGTLPVRCCLPPQPRCTEVPSTVFYSRK